MTLSAEVVGFVLFSTIPPFATRVLGVVVVPSTVLLEMVAAQVPEPATGAVVLSYEIAVPGPVRSSKAAVIL